MPYNGAVSRSKVMAMYMSDIAMNADLGRMLEQAERPVSACTGTIGTVT